MRGLFKGHRLSKMAEGKLQELRGWTPIKILIKELPRAAVGEVMQSVSIANIE